MTTFNQTKVWLVLAYFFLWQHRMYWKVLRTNLLWLDRVEQTFGLERGSEYSMP